MSASSNLPDLWYRAAHHLDTAPTAEARDRSLEILAAASTLRHDAPNTLVCPQESLLSWVRAGEHTVFRIDPAGGVTPAFFGTAVDPHNLRSLNLGPTLLERLQARLPGLKSFDGFWGMYGRLGDGVFEGHRFRITLKDGCATLNISGNPPVSQTIPADVDRAGEYECLNSLIDAVVSQGILRSS